MKKIIGILICSISFQVQAVCTQLNLNTTQTHEILESISSNFKFYITITVEEDGTLWTAFNTTQVTCKKIRTLIDPSKQRYQYGCEMPIHYNNSDSVIAPVALSFSTSKNLIEEMISKSNCSTTFVNNDQDQGTIVTCPHLKLGRYKIETQNFVKACDHPY